MRSRSGHFGGRGVQQESAHDDSCQQKTGRDSRDDDPTEPGEAVDPVGGEDGQETAHDDGVPAKRRHNDSYQREIGRGSGDGSPGYVRKGRGLLVGR
jgi:hypothetical protein